MSSDPEGDELPQPESALAQDVLEYENTVRQSAASGQLLTAIEVARDGLKRFGEGRVLKRQLALALAQTGALEAARQALDDVLKDVANDVESLCLVGRVYKEMWRRARTPAEADAALRGSCKYYGDAFARDESYYPGINLAFSLAAIGDRAKAVECAAKVARQCRGIIARYEGSAFGRALAKLGRPEPAKPDANEYGWALATLAEALLHQGEIDDARTHYRKAAALFAGRWRDLASMRRQGREILRFASQPHDWLDRCFEFPSVVVFSGHMIDLPGRAQPRFPSEREPAVLDAIRQQLAKMKAGFGYSSAASGADILFCECLLERDAKVNLVLPCPVDVFKRQSVTPAGPEWERRFHHVLANATSLMVANPAEYALSRGDAASAIAFVYSDRIVTGLAALQAAALDLELRALAVWDGQPGDGVGGTASVVEEWRRLRLVPEIIPVRGERPATAETRQAAPQEIPANGHRHEIQAMLFAEIINFTKISDRDLARFVEVFTAPLAGLIASLPAPPIASDSDGGSATFVFDALPEAAKLALEFRDLVLRTRWEEHGLPATLGVRMFLHGGPVYVFDDPVLRRTNCIGTHMTRAGRILRIVPPGQVYASQEFAALCGAEKVPGVSFEYLGHLPTAQLFHDAPLHRLDRAMPNAPG